MTVADYLAHEGSAVEKLGKRFYWDGEVFAMAGASRVHNRLTAAVLGELHAALRGMPCQPYGSGQRICVAEGGRYVYPDASVTCRPVTTAQSDEDSITNPTLVVEVLSESTEAFDRGEKFVAYRKLTSLSDYMLLSQNVARLEHFTRGPEGSWVLRTYEADAVVKIASLGIELAVNALYDGAFESPI